jgi:hypothetical protein
MMNFNEFKRRFDSHVLWGNTGPYTAKEILKEVEGLFSVIEKQQKEVKELKIKKDIPTVIEYQGRRYVLDHADNRK